MYYTNYTEIEHFKKYLIGKNLDLFDWRALKQTLIKSEKDSEDALIWWYCIEGQKIKTVFESNINSQKEMDENNAAEGSEYLHIDLTDQHLEEFTDIRNKALNIPGVTYAGIHFLGSGSVVDTHKDSDVNNFLFYLKSNDKCIFRLGQQDRKFETGDLFLFDGETEHSAYNNSDEDWIIFALRVSKNYFKEENI